MGPVEPENGRARRHAWFSFSINDVGSVRFAHEELAVYRCEPHFGMVGLAQAAGLVASKNGCGGLVRALSMDGQEEGRLSQDGHGSKLGICLAG